MFTRTLADTYEGKTLFDLFVKPAKDVKKIPYRIVQKGAVMLKLVGPNLQETERLPAGSKINIMSKSLKQIGDLELAQVNFRGRVGFVALNKIVAPSILHRVRGSFSKRIKQPNAEINRFNAFLHEELTKTNALRTVVGMKPLGGLVIQVNRDRLTDVAFAYDVPYQKNSLADFALGASPVDLNYWFSLMPEKESLSSAFDVADSYIYKDNYLIGVLSQIDADYTASETGRNKIQTSFYRLLEGRDRKEIDFFKKAVFGPDGANASTRGNKFSVTFLVEGDFKFKMLTPLYGLASLSFSGGVVKRSEMLKLLTDQQVCLVIENVSGSSVRYQGKMIDSVKIGVYRKDYLNRLRDSIKI